MTEAIFYTTNTAAIIGCLLLACSIFFHGRQFGEDLLLVRRYVAVILTGLALQRASTFTIIWPEGIEVFASQPIILICIAFIVLSMGGTALMGRHYQRNFALWVLLLLLPVVFLMVNAFMMSTGLYNPLNDRNELLLFRSSTPSIFYGRVFFVSFLLFFWLLTICMLIEAYIHDRETRSKYLLSEDADYHNTEIHYIIGWALLLIVGVVPYIIPNLWPHTLFNIMLLTALLLSALGYQRLIRVLNARADGRMAHVLITRRVPMLLNLETGGTTAWGTHIKNNPFFAGNPTLEDVAQALDVENSDLSAYLVTQETNLSAWVSDQRLRHAAELITNSDHKISEIAFLCGYNDLPTFTRAFRRQYGVAPRVFRNKSTMKILFEK